MKNGILLMNKPVGFTSHDVVAKMRGILKMKKIGHAGTLDPMATGVLPLFLGSATRACDRMPNQNKAYRAVLRFGIVTDTQDITGTILREQATAVTQAMFEDILPAFTGVLQQIPPMYSAVKIDGKRLYALARQGKTVERPARTITIFGLTLLHFSLQEQTAEILVSCSKGTYIRTLCHDIGQALGCGATLTALCRTQAGDFMLEQCVEFAQVQVAMQQGTVDSLILPTDCVFADYEPLVLNEQHTQWFCNGVLLWLQPLGVPADGCWRRIYNSHNEFIGIAKADSETGQLRNQTQFAGGAGL